MKVSLRFDGGVAVLDLAGRLMVSPGEIELVTLRTMIHDLVDAGRLHIVVNLSGLTHLDARGLGELAVAMRTLHAHGGRLKLAAASPRVARMLAVTRLDTVFEWCDVNDPNVPNDLNDPNVPNDRTFRTFKIAV